MSRKKKRKGGGKKKYKQEYIRRPEEVINRGGPIRVIKADGTTYVIPAEKVNVPKPTRRPPVRRGHAI